MQTKPSSQNSDWQGEPGGAGLASTLAVILLVGVVGALMWTLRPPSVEEVERDIWQDWARLATDSQGLTLADQLVENRQPTGQKLVDTLGRLIDNEGNRFVVPTEVRYLSIRDRAGAVFAEWTSRSADASEGGWKDLRLDLIDPQEGAVVGVLEVGYKFYGGGLDSLPNIRRLARLYRSALWFLGVLAAVTLVAVLANLLRMRERAARLQSQQITLDLAHQMCHELRNGLWAFSLEGNNLRQLFDRVDEYFRQQPAALEAAAERTGLDAPQRQRLLRTFHKQLSDRQVDPQADLVACNAMARDAHQQIESFSKYINLTVEELDRNLLGTAGAWEPAVLRVTDAWREACELLAMRLKSAGVSAREEITTDADWIRADRRALVHVFVNLVKNAIEAVRETVPPRELFFAVTLADGLVVCSLRNLGSPIPPEHLVRLFRKGFSTKRGAGRGTGLVLVRQSVQRMWGTISVTSSAAEGTTFEIRFPAATSEAA